MARLTFQFDVLFSHKIVGEDFMLATAADIVADPSAPDAFVQGIMEGKEWMLVNGVWTEQYIEEAKREIKRVSQKVIENKVLPCSLEKLTYHYDEKAII